MLPTLDLLVIVGGLATMALVNWYFFVDERPAAVAATGDAGGQEITVVVDGGYAPGTIRVQAGRPVRLAFDRHDDGSCSEEVVFADFGIRRVLPAHQRTTVEFTPAAPGTYAFACGMGMLRGRIVAE